MLNLACLPLPLKVQEVFQKNWFQLLHDKWSKPKILHRLPLKKYHYCEQPQEEIYFEELFVEESYEVLPSIEEEYMVSLDRLDEPVVFIPTTNLVEVFEFDIIREELENELRNDERNDEGRKI